MFDRPIAAFRVIPYFARRKLDIPSIDQLIDIPRDRLKELEVSSAVDPDDPFDEEEDESEADEED